MESPWSRDARIQAAWEANRSYLLAIATGMLGRPADAEDVVQEAFARLSAASIGEIDDVRGWLIVVTRRLCFDRLGSADARRTTATALPPEAAQEGSDPADRITLDDEVRRALAVVIDRLSPAERTSFILHDIFGFAFDAVAELVGRTPAACRQLARRARMSMLTGSFVTTAPPAEPQPWAAADLAERFIAVCDGGDVRGLIDLLDPDVAGLATVVGWPRLARHRPARLPRSRDRQIALADGPAAGTQRSAAKLPEPEEAAGEPVGIGILQASRGHPPAPPTRDLRAVSRIPGRELAAVRSLGCQCFG